MSSFKLFGTVISLVFSHILYLAAVNKTEHRTFKFIINDENQNDTLTLQNNNYVQHKYSISLFGSICYLVPI